MKSLSLFSTHIKITSLKIDTMNEDVLKIVLNDKTYGRDEAADIVGGLARLKRLVGKELIRAEKRTNKQNGKWHCNAYDVLKFAALK